jgi:hypothetical protein
MYLRPQVLSLITTHQCTAACDHCCFSCTPKITKAIPVDRLHSLIDEAAKIKTIRTVVFTGGECFLLNRHLDDLISRATSYNLRTRCVTNGYWGTSTKSALLRANRLKQAGLMEINFSTGTFHSKYVPKEYILNATIACLEQNIRTVLNIEIFKGDSFDKDFFYDNSTLISYQKSGLLTIQRNVWMHNEGSVDFEYAKEHTRFLEKNKTACTTVLDVITVNPDQNLIACCGLHLEKIPDLILGSIENQSIQDVLSKQKADLLKIWIHVEGPERVLDFVKKYKPDYKLPMDSVHVCETCLHIYNDGTAKQILLENYKDIEDKILEKYFSSLAFSHVSGENSKEAPEIGFA